MPSNNLLNTLIESGIIGAQGSTNFQLNGVSTLVKDPSIIGNVIQDWLKDFMKQNSIYFRQSKNSQNFPDFYMNENSEITDLLEVKCFYKSPNFDVANFKAYARSLLTNAYRLDSDYLIFEYGITDYGIVIKNIWKKKVWEICGRSERSALKIQWKQNDPVNIRPSIWYSNKTKFPSFKSNSEFLKALETVINYVQIGNDVRNNWISRVNECYLSQTGNKL